MTVTFNKLKLLTGLEEKLQLCSFIICEVQSDLSVTMNIKCNREEYLSSGSEQNHAPPKRIVLHKVIIASTTINNMQVVIYLILNVTSFRHYFSCMSQIIYYNTHVVNARFRYEMNIQNICIL